MILCGIDPDMSGGIAVVDIRARKIMSLVRIPVYTPPVSGKRSIDMVAVYADLLNTRRLGAEYVILEAAVVKPQKGKSGPVMMGGVDTVHQNYGGLRALCEVLYGRSRVIRAWPSTWKKEMGLSSDKNQSLVVARGFYPGHSSLLGKQKNAGLAEAVLLTEWAGKMNLSSQKG